MIPGEYFLCDEKINCNDGRESLILVVVNTGDRPVQVGSHFHFFEVNPQLDFDRCKAFGRRLDIPAGTAVRFEPGEQKTISLVEYAGSKTIFGFNNLINGSIVSEEIKNSAMQNLSSSKFKNSGQ